MTRWSMSVTLVAMCVTVVACSTADESATTSTSTTVAVASSTQPGVGAQVVVDAGVPYRLPSDGDASTVDVYLPEASGGPAVVLLHGWGPSRPGEPDVELGPFAEEIAQMGATVFYFRWHTNNGFSAASAADLRCIGAFIGSRAAEYKADVDSVLVIGHSMGAETGSKLALSSFGLESGPDCVESGSSPHPFAFLGIGGSYGLIAQPLDEGLTMFAVRATPISPTREIAADEFVTPGLTAADAYEIDGYSALPATNSLRIVLLVGSNDSYDATNPSITAAFAEALGESGTDVEVIEISGAGHEDVMYPDTDAGRATLEVVAALLAEAQ